MIIVRDSTPLPSRYKGSVIALGNFDGLHLGHQSVVDKVMMLATRAGAPSALMTFEPHPRKVFRPDLPTLRLLPFNEKARRLDAAGIDMLRVVRFTHAFAHTTAEQFITEILVRQLAVSHVVTGEDFIFGYNRVGNAAYLAKMAGILGFSYTTCPAVSMGGIRCSSTQIRSLLAEGNVAAVAGLLGRPYSIAGHVREGDKRGRELGFPTANIYPAGMFVPAQGVYAVRVKIDGKWAGGVANLGTRPTFAGERLQLEIHIFDWAGDIYGQRLEVAFVRRLRSEKKFDNIAALKTQITEDARAARLVLAGA